MSVHTIRLEQGVVSTPAQPNQNPSIAQSPTQARGQSPIGVALKSAVFIQSATQIRDGFISNIGYATGDYELQEKAETVTKLLSIGVGIYVAPVATLTALTISGGFDAYKNQVKQNRDQFKQEQQRVLTGSIATNGGVWV